MAHRGSNFAPSHASYPTCLPTPRPPKIGWKSRNHWVKTCNKNHFVQIKKLKAERGPQELVYPCILEIFFLPNNFQIQNLKLPVSLDFKATYFLYNIAMNKQQSANANVFCPPQTTFLSFEVPTVNTVISIFKNRQFLLLALQK